MWGKDRRQCAIVTSGLLVGESHYAGSMLRIGLSGGIGSGKSTVAALLGVCILIVFDILDGGDLIQIVQTASGPLALLFGGMVVARVIGKTGIFDWLGDAFLRATGGSGQRFLLLIVAAFTAVNFALSRRWVFYDD